MSLFNIFKTRKFMTLITYFSTTFILQIVLMFPLTFGAAMLGLPLTDNLYNFLIEIDVVLCSLAFIFIACYLIKDVLIENWKRLKFSKHFFITVIGTTFLLYILSMVCSIIAEMVTGATNPINQEMIIDSMMAFPILNILTVVILAPIAEELVFRFAMIKINSKYKYIWLIISSLIFGLLHIWGDYIYLLDYALFGFIIGFVYLKTENIWYPIAIHFLNTFISTIGIAFMYLI